MKKEDVRINLINRQRITKTSFFILITCFLIFIIFLSIGIFFIRAPKEVKNLGGNLSNIFLKLFDYLGIFQEEVKGFGYGNCGYGIPDLTVCDKTSDKDSYGCSYELISYCKDGECMLSCSAIKNMNDYMTILNYQGIKAKRVKSDYELSKDELQIICQCHGSMSDLMKILLKRYVSLEVYTHDKFVDAWNDGNEPSGIIPAAYYDSTKFKVVIDKGHLNCNVINHEYAHVRTHLSTTFKSEWEDIVFSNGIRYDEPNICKKNSKGFMEFVSPPYNGPQLGFVSAYGCTNYKEDIAEFVWAVSDPSYPWEKIAQKDKEIYLKKLNLLNKFRSIPCSDYEETKRILST